MLQYQHFIIVRFSLAFIKKGMKPVSHVLNEKRLSQKFMLFEKLCLPSLIRQKRKRNLTIIIKITNNLPAKWKNKLKSMTKKYKFIIIQEFNADTGTYSDSLNNKYLEKYIKKSTKLIATTRLDDDDVLSPHFSRIISRYINNKNINTIISFPRGYFLDTKNKKYFLHSYKLIALGLTLIQQKNKYKKYPFGVFTGQHTNWNKRARCIYLNNIMYIRTRHGVNNSGMPRKIRIRLKNGKRNVRVLKKRFPGIKI